MKTLFTKLSAAWSVLLSKEFFLTYYNGKIVDNQMPIKYLFSCDTQFIDNSAQIANDAAHQILTEEGAIESYSIIHPN